MWVFRKCELGGALCPTSSVECSRILSVVTLQNLSELEESMGLPTRRLLMQLSRNQVTPKRLLFSNLHKCSHLTENFEQYLLTPTG